MFATRLATCTKPENDEKSEENDSKHHHDVNYDNSHHDHIQNERMHDDFPKDEHIRLDKAKNKQSPAIVHDKLLHEEVNDSADAFNEIKSFEASPPQEHKARSDIPLEELERVAILYDSIRSLHKKQNPKKDEELARDFDQHLQRVMKSLYQSVQSASVPERVKSVNGLKAKYDLYDICLSKLNQLLEQQESETSEILNNIHNGVHNIVSDFYDVLLVEEPNENANRGNYFISN